MPINVLKGYPIAAFSQKSNGRILKGEAVGGSMRKSGLWCTLFFIAAQSAIVVALKRYHSFAESKLFLLSSEAVVAIATAIWYALMQPAPRKRPRPVDSPMVQRVEPQSAPQEEPPDENEQFLKAEAEEKKRLEEVVRTCEEREAFGKQRIESLEREKEDLRSKLSAVEGNLIDAQKKTDSCCQTIQALTLEVDRILGQLESERRAYSIEIRALLRKEEREDPLAQAKKKPSKAIPPRIATPPLPSLLLLLSACQKGLDLHVATDWPSNEHRPLVRRKFFDMAQKMVTTPMAIVSLDSPTEYYLSPKLPEGLDINDVREAILSYRTSFEGLKRFEPYHIIDDRMKGRYVAFRAAWDNLEDLIVLAPS